MESKNEHWNDKYLDLIDQIERDKARAEHMDATLRRAISRLSIDRVEVWTTGSTMN